MTGIKDNHVKFLTYLVYVLLALISLVLAVQTATIKSLEAKVDAFPDKYVRVERYKTDCEQDNKRWEQVLRALERVDDKLDAMRNK